MTTTITAAEKAQALVNRFKPSVYCYSGSGMLTNTPDDGVILMMSKQCAKIVVEEILENINRINPKSDSVTEAISFWNCVFSEINNLKLDSETNTNHEAN